MPTKPPTRTDKPPIGKAPKKLTTKPVQAKHVPKTFAVGPLTGDGEGEKVLIYGRSGAGKTTLAAQVAGNVFIPLDDGARKVHNPLTGKPVQAISGVDTWDDLRDAISQAVTLLAKGGSLTIDTTTRAQPLAEAWIVDNIRLEKGGHANNIEHFGYGKGYRHELDQFRCLLSDLDRVVRSGRNVILLAQLDQAIVPNAAGADYYQEAPKMIENKSGPVRTEICEWCDQILRIGYLNSEVERDTKEAKAGKITGDAERAVYSGGAQHYIAKSRPINGHRLPPVVSFDSPEDDSLWQYLLHGAVAE